jgi:hypothetical protein
VDPASHRQLLSFDYAPLTIVKQAFRWQFALACAGAPRLPVHAVVLRVDERCLCIAGSSGAGKSAVADAWLRRFPASRVLVDDWCLLRVDTKSLLPSQGESIDVRGTAIARQSLQLRGSDPRLVELCEGEPLSAESRYLVDRRRLCFMARPEREERVSALVILESAEVGVFRAATSSRALRCVFERERARYWDDSNRGLPRELGDEMHEKWLKLAGAIPVVVLTSQRCQPIDRVVETVAAFLEWDVGAGS